MIGRSGTFLSCEGRLPHLLDSHRQHGSAYAQVVVPWGRTDAEVTIDEILRRARSELDRVTPAQAWAAMGAGAVLADIRPEFQRRADGEIPGAVVIERVHLEWRCDPASPARVPEAVDHDVRWIVCCDEGYSSSLAAASLRALGLHRATDVIDGFRAWRSAGLPVVHPPHPAQPRLHPS